MNKWSDGNCHHHEHKKGDTFSSAAAQRDKTDERKREIGSQSVENRMEQCDGKGSEEIQVKVFCCFKAVHVHPHASSPLYSVWVSTPSPSSGFFFYLRENSSMKWGMPHQVVALRGRKRTTATHSGQTLLLPLFNLLSATHRHTKSPSLNQPKREKKRRERKK